MISLPRLLIIKGQLLRKLRHVDAAIEAVIQHPTATQPAIKPAARIKKLAKQSQRCKHFTKTNQES